jgi:hypothetical protein
MSLYGVQIWDINDRFTQVFYTAWRKAVRKFFSLLHPRTHCNILPLIINEFPIELQVKNRCIKFFQNISKTNNKYIMYPWQELSA